MKFLSAVLLILIYSTMVLSKENCNSPEGIKSNWQKINFSESEFEWFVHPFSPLTAIKNVSNLKNDIEYFSNKTKIEAKKADDLLNSGFSVNEIKCSLELLRDIDKCPTRTSARSKRMAINLSEQLVVKCNIGKYEINSSAAFCTMPVNKKYFVPEDIFERDELEINSNEKPYDLILRVRVNCRGRV